MSDLEAKRDERRDEELLADYLAGNRAAFEALARRYSSELFGFLLRFVNNPAIAEDLLQETLLTAFKAWRRRWWACRTACIICKRC